ncbi:hypothetical protein GCM10023176_57220 [Micromonospora coerulea]|uniref:Uncharacterized protein n=1 Tax=Micromonospora coerulea TaxID=47856 RepID=A0ABP8T4D2_9ACTN
MTGDAPGGFDDQLAGGVTFSLPARNGRNRRKSWKPERGNATRVGRVVYRYEPGPGGATTGREAGREAGNDPGARMVDSIRTWIGRCPPDSPRGGFGEAEPTG